jgi:3-dehydroquinate dehydratase
MIKPTEKVIRAMHNLENNPSWQEIVEWISNSLITQSVANNSSKGEETIKMQGRNLELQEILKHYSNREGYINNLK